MFTKRAETKTLRTLDFNDDVNRLLDRVPSDMPHLLIQGPRGCGKRLRVRLLLQEKFSVSCFKPMTLELDKGLEIVVLVNGGHSLFNLKMQSGYDKNILQAFISKVADSPKFKELRYRLIVIEDADSLSREAQDALKQTMETRTNRCRFVLISNNESEISSAIRSRCVSVNCPAPSLAEIEKILREYAPELASEDVTAIARSSGRDLGKALQYLEKVALECIHFRRIDHDIVYRICSDIVSSLRSSTKLDESIVKTREMAYNLTTACVEPRLVLRHLLSIFLQVVPTTEVNVIHQLIRRATMIDLDIMNSNKAMFHIESFCVHLLFALLEIAAHNSRRQTIVRKKGP